MANTKIRQIPAKERLCVTYISRSDEYLITRLPDKKYCIYRKCDGGLERLGKGDNPLELESKYVRRNRNQ